jgi:hypothetical protein
MTRAPRRRGIVATMIVLGIAVTTGGVIAGAAGAGARSTQAQPATCGPQGTGATVAAQDCTLEVTKVVTGKAASGTTFTVGVDCTALQADRVNVATDGGQTPPFTTTLTFGENGGTQHVLSAQPASCTVTETPPPGCTLTSIDPHQPVPVETTNPVVVTVTNDCAPAPTTPTPTTTVPAGQPAAAVVGVPSFTG